MAICKARSQTELEQYTKMLYFDLSSNLIFSTIGTFCFFYICKLGLIQISAGRSSHHLPPQLTLLINFCIPVKPTREPWFQMVCIKHLYFSLAVFFSLHWSRSSDPNERLTTTPQSLRGGHTRAHTGVISCLWSGQRPDPHCPHPLHINAQERAHTHTHR